MKTRLVSTRSFIYMALAIVALLLAFQTEPVSAQAGQNFLYEMGTVDGYFDAPSGVVQDTNGNIYVADSHDHRIQVFDAAGNFLFDWGSYGSGNGQFVEPWGLAVDPGGRTLYVADTSFHRISVFDDQGSTLFQWGAQGSGNGDFGFPAGVAVDTKGNVYVADTLNHRVQVFELP